MEARPGGRFCQRCETVVVDLVGLSRAQAEARVAQIEGPELCVQLSLDRFGEAVFAAPPRSWTPHFVGGLVLITALGAGGCTLQQDPAGASAEVVPERLEIGPPMTPTPAEVDAGPPAIRTGAVPSSELNVDVGGATARPTSEQRALTSRKNWRHRVRGRMPRHGF